jgi:hypothetical protein
MTPDGSVRVRYELLALRLYVHGPEAVSRRVVRGLSRGGLWLETRNLLRSNNFAEAEIASLMGLHRKGCPCWNCVIALNRAVRRTTNRRKRPPASSVPNG